MTTIFARKALLQKGWAENVRLRVDAGRLVDIETGTSPGGTDLALGVVIPGLTNAHSHAFQRALAGRTEERSPAAQDSFWTWRQRMYELAARLDPEALTSVAAQAYTEMLESGYTAVAEFHYLHWPASGATSNEMFGAIAAAAGISGIRMTYVPIFYERAGFGAPEPETFQEHFAHDVDTFLDHHLTACTEAADQLTIAIGAHSLRAVSETSLQAIVSAANGGPMHLHIAEQQGEVEQCVAATGQRPVQWLLDNFAIDSSWCLVHATHMNPDETRDLARSGAVVCLCPSTEANLGDGLFPLRDYLEHDGRIAIGSDSQVSINPFEELRWLEYGQRLATQSRNVAALTDAHVGRELFMRVLQGGTQAVGAPLSGLQRGAPADLVVLDDDDPMLAGHATDTLLDALVFSGFSLPIDRVMVHGEWRVIDGRHIARNETRSGYARAIEHIWAQS